MADGTSRIIVLESDRALGRTICTTIWAETGMRPCVAAKATEAAAFIHDYPDTVFAAAVGFEVRGASALFDKLTENNIPSIAYGRDFNDDIRKHVSTLTIADIVVAERDAVSGLVGQAVGRMVKNRNVTILVVDDSRSMRLALVRFLATRRYTILEASDGAQALAQLAKHPQIRLVITDNEMPHVDGFTLVKEIRKTHSKDDLAVIGISAKSNSLLSVRFINNGANDFLHKPFLKEELFCRVDHNVEMLERIEIIRDLSNKDPLTRLFNRRYFFENCDEFVTRAEEAGKVVVAAMLDIDHFKQVNDTYGHDVGDTVLKAVSARISDHFREGAIVSRFGGEEFCILAAHRQDDDIFARYDKLRRDIEGAPVKMNMAVKMDMAVKNDMDVKKDMGTGDEAVEVTISAGVCTRKDSVQAMIKEADAHLYEAKEGGRNRVVLS